MPGVFMQVGTDSPPPRSAVREDSSSEPRRRTKKPDRGTGERKVHGTPCSSRTSGGGMTILAPVDGYRDPSSRKARRKAKAEERRQAKIEKKSDSVACSMHVKTLAQKPSAPVVGTIDLEDAVTVTHGVSGRRGGSDRVSGSVAAGARTAVSYTHLTLPTILLV